ncbi:PhnE/PtxC family ABC transporter permease [Rubritalea marina]|uniref:PhnE/PtxC family ABC transporter permease n=1 Tax=Rubritalea marina TaxID=361055 RepID=UPI00036937ED|nr:ABC transporter permease subunit [Rubritalea marina]
MDKSLPPTAPLMSWRRGFLLGFILVTAYCLWELGIDFVQLPPSASPYQSAINFFSAAWQPAFVEQNPSLPDGSPSFINRIFGNLLTTLRYAFIAMSMAVPAGLVLGFFASRIWLDATKHLKPLLWANYLAVRFITTVMRSIHELIWVLLFLSFLGDSPLTACIALAIPFTGTLAKVFSEIIDEQDPASSEHIHLAGGSSVQAFLAARFVIALPDLLTYTMYRLECAIRSSAVLGFMGLETIGLAIKQSYENNYYNEVWTELYLLTITVICFDVLGTLVRKRLHRPAPSPRGNTATASIAELKQARPRWKLLPITWWLLILGAVIAWTVGDDLNQYHSHLSRWERFCSFAKQLIPEPVRHSGNWNEALPWLSELWKTDGAQGLHMTIIIATAALCIASTFGYLLAPWASRNIANASPFGIHQGPASALKAFSWRVLGFCLRSLFTVARSMPEYIIAFLLIGILGAHTWPLVIALAIHNFGILGRLWAEVNENHDQAVSRHLAARGATRTQAYLFGLLPTSFNRHILFIFYRWETCVRESTILGMLSISSLGYLISRESSFLRYDSMMYFIGLGVLVVFASDLISVTLRRQSR